MALKKLPKEMSYEAIRHKHPPTPNHKEHRIPVKDTITEKTVEPSNPQEILAAVPVDGSKPAVETPVEPRKDLTPGEAPQSDYKSASASATGKGKAGKSVRVRGYINIPPVGEKRDFDDLREIYGEKDAIALALSRGMASYEAALGEAKLLQLTLYHDRNSRRIEASRTMAHDLYMKAVEHLDPKGMLGRSQIGSRILGTALTYYLGEG